MRSVLATIAVAAALWPGAAAADSAATGPFAGLVDVGGREVYLECKGTGRPTVILISGYRNNAEIWTTPPAAGVTPVFDAVAAFTHVCAYDRPGTILDATHLSRSDPVPMPRTAEAVVEELHDLVTAAEVPGPYVLAAHSLGGLFARLYASTYPENVSGMVLVDAWQESLEALLGPEQWTAYEAIASGPPPGLDYRDLELVDFGAASRLMAKAAARQPLQPMPLIVISRTRPVALPPDVPAAFSPEAFEKAWRQGQNRLAALLPDARHIFAEKSDHYIQLEQPELVIDAVREVVEAVRDPASWTG